YLSDNWNPYRWVSGGIRAESSRLAPDGVYCCYEGIITKKGLLADLIKCSPTRLETYGDCPFRYFAGTVLNLEGLEEVEDEVSLLDLGTFYHRVLRELFKLLAKRMGGKVDLRKVKDEELIKALNGVLGNIDFEEYLPGLSTMMREILKIRVREEVLPHFVLAEAERIREWNERGFYPTYFEKVININIGGIGTKTVADRVDIGKQGALIIDYKLRSSSSRKFSSYKHLQLPLYLSALKSEGFSPYGGYYRFVEKPDDEKGSERGKKGFEEDIDFAWSRAEMYISLMKQGFFAPVVVDKESGFEKKETELSKEGSGCGWCDFWDLCRVREGIKRRL
ncbi:MAG TPA: PD-(D/E)XK nuclease family protein, partial [Thermodesulfobacteriota bacterium]|nr:PD-(D/E)XK nuclease family protein [Thermodesulfobacteriota bacterium]